MDLKIEIISIASLRPWARNARTHSRKQVKQIAESIRSFGFTNPVLIDSAGNILAGHGRVEAAKLLGMVEVPCVRLEHMSPEQKRAYVLADNKLALNAGWDDEILAEELRGLLETDFDVEITGFSISEIDSLVEGLIPEEPGDPDDDIVPAIEDGAPRCKVGDVWQLGPHRLVCGSALENGVVDSLMTGDLARMVFTDPPYNVPIDGHVGNSGAVNTPSSLWRQARCRSPSSPPFCAVASQTWCAQASTAPFTSSVWTGGTCLRCLPQAKASILSSRIYRVGERQRRHGNLLPLPP